MPSTLLSPTGDYQGETLHQTQDEAARRHYNFPVVHRAVMPASFPSQDPCRDRTPQAQHRRDQPIPVQRPRYSAEQLLDLQGGYRGILRSAETMQSAPPAAQEDPAVQILLRRSRHLQEVMHLVQQQVRINTEQIQAVARREQQQQHRLEHRRSQRRRALQRASRLYYRVSFRRESGSSRGTQQHNPLPHLNQQTTFRHDSVIGRESHRSDELFTPEQMARIARRQRRDELFTPEQMARIARRQSHDPLRRSRSPNPGPAPSTYRRHSPILPHQARQSLVGHRSQEQQSYRAQRPLDHHHPLGASWPRDPYRPQSSSVPSSPPLWIRRHQPRPAARQGFRSPDTNRSDASSYHAEDDIEQMRHSWPQASVPARSRAELGPSPRHGVPLAPRPEPDMWYVANSLELARQRDASRREPPPPPSPAHAMLYSALPAEEGPSSRVDSAVATEQEPASRGDGSPASPFLIALSSEEASPLSPVHRMLYPEVESPDGEPLLSEVGVQWGEVRWNADRERTSVSSRVRSPLHGSWDVDLEEGEIRE